MATVVTHGSRLDVVTLIFSFKRLLQEVQRSPDFQTAKRASSQLTHFSFPKLFEDSGLDYDPTAKQ